MLWLKLLLQYTLHKRTIFLEILFNISISNDLEMMAVVEEGHTWMKEIVDYIVDGPLSPNKFEA